MSDDRHGELQRWADRGHPRGAATLLEQVVGSARIPDLTDVPHAYAGKTIGFAERSVRRIAVTFSIFIIAIVVGAWIAIVAVNAFAKVLSTPPIDADVT